MKKTLCVITSERYARTDLSHLTFSELALRGGASMIQLRDKTLHDRDLFAMGVALKAVCMAFHAQLIINDRVDIALAVDADGVHLGQEDLPVEVVRRILRKGKLIGGSASTIEEAVALEKASADYIGFGHVFETKTKMKPYEPRGLYTLKKVCQSVHTPVLAIGGVTSATAESVMASGANGIALVSEIASSHDPETATRNVLKRM